MRTVTSGRLRACADGFTLIEALVALAIGGFVIATLATITGQWLRAWSSGFPILQSAELLAASLDRITADLAATRFIPVAGGGAGVIFSGDASSVTFVRRALPIEAPGGGLELVRLSPPPGSDVTLSRSRSMLAYGANVTSPADASPLAMLRAPYAVRFSYADAGQVWQATWTTPGRVPRFIRVEVTDRRTGRKVLAPEVVAVHVTAPAACATATSAKLCDSTMGISIQPNPTTASGANPQAPPL